ncbi:MAG: DUF1232 domain-containing protein [Acidobacteriota bacterium]
MDHDEPLTDDSPDETSADLDAVGGSDPYDDDLPSRGLLSFYDRLRRRVTDHVERRGGTLGPRTTEALLLVPDVFILLVRLMLDKDVPKATRTLIGGALAYFVLPFDLLPEAIVGPAGFVDDLVLALTVMAQVFSPDLEAHAERYWSGSKKLRRVIADILGAAQGLLGVDLYDRLRGALAQRGIDLDEATASAESESPSA